MLGDFLDDAIQIQFFCVQNLKTLSAKGDKIKYFWPIWLHPKPFFLQNSCLRLHTNLPGVEKSKQIAIFRFVLDNSSSGGRFHYGNRQKIAKNAGGRILP
jgi:hypothetical protein